jgi:Tol biopolymer transport system component
MNAPYDIERDLTRWMAAVVPTRAPDNLAPSIVTRTRSMRPNPAWLARLKEPPMQTQLSLRNYLGFGRSLRPILVAVLILALVAGGIIVGSRLLRQQSLPPPFGLAGNGLIATDVGGTIVVMRPDGSDAHQLELPFDGLAQMTFSRDGTRLASWWTPDPVNPGQVSLMVANADGSAAVEIGTSRQSSEGLSRIDWSPDDRSLAFSNIEDRLFVANVDARTVRELGPDDRITRRRDPVWSPNGQLAYRCETTDAVLHLCVMDPAFQTERILTTSPGTEWAFQHSSWSHDGKFIAYYVNDVIDQPKSTPGFDVAILDLATEKERVLTRGFVPHAILPVFSPDDGHVLFMTETGPGVVRTDGTGLNVFGRESCQAVEPSPDGQFVTCLLGQQVVLYPIDGGAPTTLALDRQATSVAWQRVSN